jgi:hypothetical protein
MPRFSHWILCAALPAPLAAVAVAESPGSRPDSIAPENHPANPRGGFGRHAL